MQYHENWSFIISSFPITLPALIVSDMGATYISIFHYLIFGIGVQYICNFFYEGTNLAKLYFLIFL